MELYVYATSERVVVVKLTSAIRALNSTMQNFRQAVVSGIGSSVGTEIACELFKSGWCVHGLITSESDKQALIKSKASSTKRSKYLLFIQKYEKLTEENVKSILTSRSVDVIPLVFVNYVSFDNESFRVLTGNDTEDSWQQLVNTKLQRMEMFAREAIEHINTFEITGYILNINSVYGHTKLCTAWRDAILSLSNSLQKELSEAGSKIKVMTITEDNCTGELFFKLKGHEFKEYLSKVPSDIAAAVMSAINSYEWNCTPEMIVRRNYSC